MKHRFRLSNGFFLECAEVPGKYYYHKPGILLNVISTQTIENHLAMPDNKIWLEIDKVAKKLEKERSPK